MGNAKSDAITYATSTLSSVNAYEDALSNALISTNEALKDEAISELASIESLSNDNVLATERVATNMLNAKRVVLSLESGQSAISLGSVSVVKSSPKVLILTLSVVLGGMVGVFFILVRNAITKRKEQLASVRNLSIAFSLSNRNLMQEIVFALLVERDVLFQATRQLKFHSLYSDSFVDIFVSN